MHGVADVTELFLPVQLELLQRFGPRLPPEAIEIQTVPTNAVPHRILDLNPLTEYFPFRDVHPILVPLLLMINYLQTISVISARQLLLSFVAITIGTALPGAAQQTSRQDLKTATAAVIAERSDLYNKKDAGGIAAEFTEDATFVELLPRLEVMHGKAEIQKHYQQLFDAGATNFSQKITQVELNGNDTGVMAGDYTVFANAKRITGHWFEILRQEAGTWKTSVHVFARPESIIEWQLEYP